MGPLLLTALTAVPLAKCNELLARGITRRQIQYGLDTGRVLAPVPGIYCLRSTEQTTDPLEFEMALGHRCSGGVIHGPTAALYHGLTDEMPDFLHLLVPRDYTDCPSRRPWKLHRSRLPSAFSVGVYYEDVLGVRVPVTDQARTVLDLYRYQAGRQHELEALRNYLGRHGSIATLEAYDRQIRGEGYRMPDRLRTDAESILAAKERSPR